MGTGAGRTCVAVAGPRLAECGMNGAGSLTTGRPCDPTFAHRQTGTNGGTQGSSVGEIKPQTNL